MRDITRLFNLYNAFQELHILYSDLRFGQIIELIRKKCGIDDLFYIEDEDLTLLIKSVVTDARDSKE